MLRRRAATDGLVPSVPQWCDFREAMADVMFQEPQPPRPTRPVGRVASVDDKENKAAADEALGINREDLAAKIFARCPKGVTPGSAGDLSSLAMFNPNRNPAFERRRRRSQQVVIEAEKPARTSRLTGTGGRSSSVDPPPGTLARRPSFAMAGPRRPSVGVVTRRRSVEPPAAPVVPVEPQKPAPVQSRPAEVSKPLTRTLRRLSINTQPPPTSRTQLNPIQLRQRSPAPVSSTTASRPATRSTTKSDVAASQLVLRSGPVASAPRVLGTRNSAKAPVLGTRNSTKTSAPQKPALTVPSGPPMATARRLSVTRKLPTTTSTARR